MIIRAEQDHLLFITQPDYAAAAADLVIHVEGFAHHPRRAGIELAVREHNHGWMELDETLVFDPAAGRAPAPASVKVRRVPNRPYATVDELREALGRAPAQILAGTVGGGPRS
jgi:hypothetical protein